MFEPGQQVLCVDGRFPEEVLELYHFLPIEGHVYVVRDVQPGVELNGSMTVSVLLEGLVNEAGPSGYERGFAPWRFASEEDVEEAMEDEAFWREFEEMLKQDPMMN